MAVHTDYIRDFLERWETRQTVAYIPCRKRNFTGHNSFADCGEVIGASGVTVGTGLDLGQQREADLRRMGLGQSLISVLTPYLGRRREDAVTTLSIAPLTLTDAQVDAVDAAVHDDYIRRAAERYDRDAVDGLTFEDCPAQVQAVIVSLFYQLGDGRSRYPRTWRLLCAADWLGAGHELMTGFSQYTRRRRDEGKLLMEVA